MDLVDEGAIVLTSDFRFLVYNRAAARFFGPAPEPQTLIEWERGCGLYLGGEPSNIPSSIENLPWRRLLAGDSLETALYIIRNPQHPSGLWVTIRGHAETDEQGIITAAFLAIRDSSARRIAEISQVQWERRFKEFMRYLPGVAFMKDADGRYLFFSESSVVTTGVDAEAVIGKTDEDIWPREFTSDWRKNDQEVLNSRKALRVREDFPKGDSVHRWTVYKFPIPDEQGEMTLVGGVGVDDNDRLHLEARLQQAEKMEAIGRLAGGVAHDFNNLLTVISGYGQMLQDALKRDLPAEKMNSYLEELLSAGKRAVDLTDQLLAFSRRKVSRPRRVDLREQVREVERVLSRAVGELIELRVEESPEPCDVMADPMQLTQVILNLVANAREAMPQGGRLTLSTGISRGLENAAPDQKFALLEVADTGSAIGDETLPHIFEPFFAPKSHSKGSGLGLSTVYGIVKQAGGEIMVTSKPEAGTVFRVYFPALEPAPPVIDKPGKQSVPAEAPAGKETILLVEDNTTVRNLVKTMLEAFGYQVIAADSGPRALELFEEHQAEIKLLLTDVIMPQMSGRELATKLGRKAPKLKILYMSGYTADEIALQGVGNGKPNLLAKPFDSRVLAQRVREALDLPAQPN